jgi:hypothetical protein
MTGISEKSVLIHNGQRIGACGGRVEGGVCRGATSATTGERQVGAMYHLLVAIGSYGACYGGATGDSLAQVPDTRPRLALSWQHYWACDSTSSYLVLGKSESVKGRKFFFFFLWLLPLLVVFFSSIFSQPNLLFAPTPWLRFFPSTFFPVPIPVPVSVPFPHPLFFLFRRRAFSRSPLFLFSAAPVKLSASR